jgi:hypothetical protein
MTPINELVKALKGHFPIQIEGSKVTGVALHVHNFEQESVSIYVHATKGDKQEQRFCGYGKTPSQAVEELEKNIRGGKR